MASLADILTTQKNGVIAINGIATNVLSVISAINTTLRREQGTATSGTVTASTLIRSGSGYVARVCVVVAGTTEGSVYNASSTGTVAAGNRLFAVPNTVGVYNLGQVFDAGLVLTPGTGQSLNVTYSAE